MRFPLSLALICFTSACATTTVIESDPPGAMVTYHGRELGRTPLDYESEDWLWEKRELEVSAPGYHSRTVHLKRDKLNVPVAIGSAVVFWFLCLPAGVGMFLAGGMDYPEEVFIKLSPASGWPEAAPPRRYAPTPPPAPPRGREPTPAPPPATAPPEHSAGY